MPTARRLPLKSRGSPGFLLRMGNTVLQQIPSFSKHSVQHIIWGIYQYFEGSSTYIFRLHNLREGIWAKLHHQRQDWRLLALLPLFWKNSSPLIESTWFTAKLDGGNHLTEILDDSGRKRYPLFVLLSPDCHHPFPSSQEKLPALGLTLRSAGGGHALELAVSHILFFDPGLWKRHFVKAEIVIRLTWVMWPKEQRISLAH